MNHYQTLGINQQATQEEIKRAYRQKAAKCHPDRGGSTEEFQRLEEAYRILSDPQTRQQYDNPSPFQGGGPGGFSFSFGGGNPFDDFFSQFTQQRQSRRVYTVQILVTLEQVAAGSEEAVQINTSEGVKTFNIKIPQGVPDGGRVRYERLMPDGDLQVEFRIRQHSVYERSGLDLRATKKVSIFQLVTGTTVTITSLSGDLLSIVVPPRTNPGTTLRVAKKGLSANGQTGDILVLIQGVIPSTISTELLAAISQEPTNPN